MMTAREALQISETNKPPLKIDSVLMAKILKAALEGKTIIEVTYEEQESSPDLEYLGYRFNIIPGGGALGTKLTPTTWWVSWNGPAPLSIVERLEALEKKT